MSLPQELFAFARRPDTAFGWREEGRAGRQAELRLRSQEWRGRAWDHRLSVAVPQNAPASDTALLTITASDWGTRDVTTALLADAVGLPCATLYDVPNQPLFDMLVEDALIAHTFLRHLETGDDDWPLLFPMVKSAVRALDALSEFLRAAFGREARRFVVTGASKRGWTTWLTAVADERVAGIAPLVYDNLNLAAQLPHQVATMGGFSPSIHDYTELDLPTQFATPAGQRLGLMVDPYTYRERLALPKLIVNGTNDPYWATDALDLYWNALPGPKSVLYAPNSGHFLEDGDRVFNALAAFARATARGETLPALGAEWGETRGTLRLNLTLEAAATGARVWAAHSETPGFHAATWTETPLVPGGGGAHFTGHVITSGSRYTAAFGEASFAGGGSPYTLSTPMRVHDRDGRPA